VGTFTELVRVLMPPGLPVAVGRAIGFGFVSILAALIPRETRMLECLGAQAGVP
jgi:hypothetical protein